MAKQIGVYSIDSGVPIPVGSTAAPLRALEVGESFVFDAQMRTSMRSTATRIGKNEGRKFVTRKINDNLYRVWRIE